MTPEQDEKLVNAIGWIRLYLGIICLLLYFLMLASCSHGLK